MSGVHKDGSSRSTPSDLAALWMAALTDYYKTSGLDLSRMPRYTSLKEIMRDRSVQKGFEKFRGEGGDVMRLGHLISSHTELVLKGAKYVADAVSAAFPPSSVILTAMTLILTAAHDVSNHYDKIMTFLEEMNAFLERIQMLEDKLPQLEGYQNHLLRVITAMLRICGLTRKAIDDGRMKRFGKIILRGGEDPALSAATGSLETAMKRLESATGIATLAGVQDIKDETKHIKQRGEDIYGLIVDMNANQQKSDTEMKEQWEAMVARFDKMYEKQSRSGNPSTLASETRPVDPGLRKQAAFNTINALFPDRNSPISHSREIERVLIEGTGGWLQGNQDWLDWQEAKPFKNILWLTGPAGSGKSCATYVACADLKLSTASDLSTSVAAVYLKDFAEDEYPFRGILCSIVNQIAARNVAYCERVAAIFHRAYSGIDWGTLDTLDSLWNQLIENEFNTNSKTRLFIVLDGVDENGLGDTGIVHDALGTEIAKRLKQVVDKRLRIQVCVTSRPTWVIPVDSFNRIEMGKEETKRDMRSLVAARIASSPRLSRCRTRTRKLIKLRVLTEAENLLAAEHMLLMLSQIHQEDTIISQLTQIPGTLHGLFERLESAILRNRRPRQTRVLRTLFAWLAFASRPLTVADVDEILRTHLDDQAFSFEEELSGPAGQILEFASISEDEYSESDSESESGILQQSVEQDKFDREVSVKGETILASHNDTSILRFRNRSLREFFTSSGGKAEELRSDHSRSHAAIFETSVNLICGMRDSPLDDCQNRASRALMDYATSSWAHHFDQIKVEELQDDQIVTVLHLIKDMLTNKNNAVNSIVEHCGQHKRFFDSMSWGADRYVLVQDTLPKWLLKGSQLGEERLGDTFDWVKRSTSDANIVMADSLRAYTKFWLQGCEHPHWTAAYGLGLSTLLLTDGLDISFNPFDEANRHLGNSVFIMPKTMEAIAFYSGSTDDWKTHNSLARAMAWAGHIDEALATFDAALRLAQTEIEKAEVLSTMAWEAHEELVRRLVFRKQEQPTKDVSSGTASVKSDDNNEYRRYKMMAKGALQTFSLAGSSDYKQQIRLCALTIARCCQELGQVGEAIEAFDYARKIIPEIPLDTQMYYMFAKEYEKLGPGEFVDRFQEWNGFEIMVWAGARVFNEPEFSYPGHQLEALHRAAKVVGRQDVVIQMYEAIIRYLESRGGGADMQLLLGSSYLHDFFEVDGALAKAKKLFYRVLSGKFSKNFIMGSTDLWAFENARNFLVEVMYEQFRVSRSVATKQQILEEMRKLQEEHTNEILQEVDPGESLSAIVHACMIRKIGSKIEYEEILTSAFRNCLTTLMDADGNNDQASLLLLAKTLVCVPGMQRDARIAYSAQYSIIDQKIALTGSDGKLGLRSASNSMENGSTYGAVDRELLSWDSGLLDQENVAEEQRYKYVTHPQWGDILPCDSVFCGGNRRHKIVHWESVPTYLCIICMHTQLCSKCYENLQLLNEGKKSWNDIGGRKYCGCNHRYIKGPIEGWCGIRDGYLTIENGESAEKILFKDWLRDLDTRWTAAWSVLWTQEDIQSAIG